MAAAILHMYTGGLYETGEKLSLCGYNQKGRERRARRHPWVYAEEITERRGELRQGCIADVFSQKGAWLGAGFYSETSKIGVRILSDNANESFGPEFFERRVKYALEYRRAVMEDLGCCRLIFGEADGLPGLTVDKFSDILGRPGALLRHGQR